MESRSSASIASVNAHMYNTNLLSDEALVDECMAIKDVDEDRTIDICIEYLNTKKLSKSSRKYLCMFYIIYYSTEVNMELC